MNAIANSIDTPKEVKVLIAIQARSNSTRFPQKIYQMLGKKMVLQHVIDHAYSAKVYVERPSLKRSIKCEIAVLHPANDMQLITTFRNSGATLVPGDELDVLSRYITAQKQTKADYVVRLTSDCPLILDFIISKHINVAVLNDLDYVNNVHEECRQAADGLDVEIMSAKAIKWLEENAKTPEEREHVTIAIRNRKPSELAQAFISSKFNTSNMKLSLDTEEDLHNIRSYFHEREFKMHLALKNYGWKNIFEL